ncbi:hypothetical protein [Neobacillus niacini]|uniref:hypothetical protein n=1 Tax=Neobacillus niacini TaxID=86668 RepID=UPI0021CB813F|nr:hypothetical protein [Neobacillus niacini]MCM3765075.1 hypothetical protein [Neobacillus niacini]
MTAINTPEVAVILNILKENPNAIIKPEQIGAATQAIIGEGGTAEKIGTNIGKIIAKIKEVNPFAVVFLYNITGKIGSY